MKSSSAASSQEFAVPRIEDSTNRILGEDVLSTPPAHSRPLLLSFSPEKLPGSVSEDDYPFTERPDGVSGPERADLTPRSFAQSRVSFFRQQEDEGGSRGGDPHSGSVYPSEIEPSMRGSLAPSHCAHPNRSAAQIVWHNVTGSLTAAGGTLSKGNCCLAQQCTHPPSSFFWTAVRAHSTAGHLILSQLGIIAGCWRCIRQ